MSLTTFKPPIQFPLFTHQPPLHHHIHHHRPTTTTIIRFSRWNNANAKKHIQKHQQTQHDIETHLRFDKRFQTAHNIITKAPPPPPQTTVTPPSPPSPEFKSAGTPSVPSQPSIPGKKSKYSKGVDPRKANFEDDDLGSGEPSWGTAVTPPLSYGGFSNDPDAQNARKVDFGKVNPRNPSFGNDELGSGEGLYSSAVFPPLLSGGFSKDPDAQNDRKLDFGKVNPRNPSFGNGDLGSGERFYSTAGAPPLSSGRWSKNPDAQKANFKYPNPRKPSFEKYDSFSGEQSWGTAGGLPLSSDRFPKNPDGQNARKANFKYPNPRNPSFGNNDLGSGEPLGGTTISQPLSSGRFPKNPYAQKPRNANFGKYGSGQKSKETKFGNSNSGNANYQHPAFKRIVKMRQIESEIDEDTCVKVDEKGLSYVIPEAPFEFQYSYTETPKVKPIKLREAAIAPFGPGTIPRPWTGRKPLAPSKKKLEFDSFVLPPPHKKGVKPVQAPGPFLAGSGPKYVRERDEVLGEALSKEEVDDLIKGCLKSDRQLNMGRDGLTHNMLDNIHAHWKRRRVCKIKCKGVCTVDMDNVRQQLEEKTGGKIIYSKGGVVYLFRGRNYNYKTRPVFPLMLWKPITPVYPRLIQRAPDGLTIEEASEMRHRGRQLIPICKLGKNGVYSDLAKNVREAFEACELVRINCEGMNGSDYRKIGAKLKDLVPCVLISFEQEHILMWRGRDWKSMFTQENEHQEANNDPDTESIDSLVASLESSPEDLTADEYEENEDENTTHTESIDSLVASIESSAEDLTEDEIEENEDEKITRENFDDNENMTPHDSEDDISETTSKHDCLEGVMSLLNQAVQDGIAVVLEDPSLDADVVYAMAVAFSKSALPGPAFRHLRPDKVAMDITERQEHGENSGERGGKSF